MKITRDTTAWIYYAVALIGFGVAAFTWFM
jgi:hypothetical protein